jgi:hypothetical protein
MQRYTTTRGSKSRESQEPGQCFFSNQCAWSWLALFVRGRLDVTNLGVSSVAFVVPCMGLSVLSCGCRVKTLLCKTMSVCGWFVSGREQPFELELSTAWVHVWLCSVSLAVEFCGLNLKTL